MRDDVLAVSQQVVRATDSNSLLRMYDHAKSVRQNATLQQEQERADRALQRIANELKKRKVLLQDGSPV
jgi:hypothetical protein